jgi:hypothetical protein
MIGNQQPTLFRLAALRRLRARFGAEPNPKLETDFEKERAELARLRSLPSEVRRRLRKRFGAKADTSGN